MPSLETADHRQSSAESLVEALHRRDALALAEACSRTLPAAHGVARRLVPRADVEPVLRDVYITLWEDPPFDGGLERWVRQRCFASAAVLLRRRGAPPVAHSAQLLLEDLPAPAAAFLDGTEHALASLGRDAVLALLRAHDAGVAAGDGPAGSMATRALLALADSDLDVAHSAAAGADWVLGLVDPSEAALTGQALEAAGADLVRALRRGRRRLEGLPPGPDLAARLVAVVLSASPPTATGVHATSSGPRPASTEPPPSSVGPPLAEPSPSLTEPPVAGPTLAEPGFDREVGDEELPGRRPRTLLLVVGWIVAVVAAVGTGMLIGRLLLELGVI